MRLTGKISAWTDRGYGHITVRTGTSIVRYFLHISRIISIDESLDEPVVGCPVTFEPTNGFKRHPKDYASAINAEVSAPLDAALQLLAGGS